MLPQRGFGRGCEFQIARSKQFVIENVTITLLSFIIFLQCKDKLRNGHFFYFCGHTFYLGQIYGGGWSGEAQLRQTTFVGERFGQRLHLTQ